jgi:hypothetical protein
MNKFWHGTGCPEATLEASRDCLDEVGPQLAGWNDPVHGAHGHCSVDAVDLIELAGYVAELL